MGDAVPQELLDRLKPHGQEHLLRWWSELTDDRQIVLRRQLESIDFELVARLIERQRTSDRDTSLPASEDLHPPEHIVSLPQTADDSARRDEATRIGHELLAAGRVAAVLVAGGEGTRLGFDHPKGMFPIGPVSERSLFQLFAEQLLARRRRSGAVIPYFIMTSAATHDETVDFFQEHEYFGLDADSVFFFQQGTMPAVDVQTGRILMADKGTVALTPDGHGGVLAALQRTGLFDEMQRRGTDLLYYHQVDNPAAVLCDPAFLGFHRQYHSDVSTKVVAKTTAAEKMGVVVGVHGQTRVIEYSNLPDKLAGETDENGQLRLWAGNTAMHVFNVEFLRRMADEQRLPFHVAHKKVPFLDETGTRITPKTENAWKFEQFIFDVLPPTRTALVMECERTGEFLPVKNASGSDSPETARAGMIRLYTQWLQAAGGDVKPGVPVEISPLYALDADELRARLPRDCSVKEPTVFNEHGPAAAATPES